DNDPRGEYHRIGAPATANLAIAFQAAGMDAIAQSDTGAVTKLAASHSLCQMMLTTAYGQYLDIQNPEDEAAYWNLVRTKSSPFFGSALHVGALLGGASADVATQIEQFGHIYGEMIQIHDDLNDTMAVPANPDWTLGRLPLPILFAQIVDHPEKARFIELREAITNPDALTEAQEILVRCGAVSYCIDQLVRRYQSAIEIMSTLPLTSPGLLEGLLDDVITPVMKLFSAVGVDEPEALLQTQNFVV
ncbi:MAG: polyprenyl synthetase family protein, partial [Chloroflexi bacterium]|nr:polyprenyl synthetase family protein [Chloroflexota bacterium]